MGQKVNPISLRVSVNKGWKSRWYSGKKFFGDFLHEDILIRNNVRKRLETAAISDILIERYGERVRVVISTARPGMVIGRRGQDVEQVRLDLSKSIGKEVYLDIKEIKQADLDAQLVAENIAVQLVRRVSFRRAMKKAISNTMSRGASGIKVMVSGRLGGAELARSESYKEGSIPLHTLRSKIDYGFVSAQTKSGAVGVKVWICLDQKDKDDIKRRIDRASVS